MAKTLGALRLEARQSADMEGDPLIDNGLGPTVDADNVELDSLINNAIRELYALEISARKGSYLTLDTPFTLTAGGGNTRNVPVGFWKERGLDMLRGTRWCPVPVFNWRERGRDVFGPPRYRIDSLIRLSPEERAAGTYRLWYWPTAPVLTAAAQTLDATLDKWSRFVVLHTAIAMLTKANLDTSVHERALSVLTAQIANNDADRQGEPEQAPIPDEYGDPWW